MSNDSPTWSTSSSDDSEAAARDQDDEELEDTDQEETDIETSSGLAEYEEDSSSSESDDDSECEEDQGDDVVLPVQIVSPERLRRAVALEENRSDNLRTWAKDMQPMIREEETETEWNILTTPKNNSNSLKTAIVSLYGTPVAVLEIDTDKVRSLLKHP